MKRFAAAAVAVLLLIPAVSVKASGPPELSAASAILMDAESGRVLFEQNAHEERAIASITKLMTALVVAESGHDAAEEVTIQPEWTGIEGSSIYLRTGENVTLETLLYGLLLNSGNDAAVAVAAHCAGSVDAFVEQMNQCAARLGMNHTHFANPNGLSEEGHYSTAYDMALLARACTQNELVSGIAATKTITLGTRTFTNHNKLLWRYEGCTGMKTGYTEASGRTLVSSAEQNGQTLIVVTLNAPNDWNDHASLLNYGFETFPRRMLCTAEKRFRNVPITGSLTRFIPAVTNRGLYYPLAAQEQVRAKVELAHPVDAPVEEGAVLGKLSFYLDDMLIGETALVAGQAVSNQTAVPQTFLGRLKDFFSS